MKTKQVVAGRVCPKCGKKENQKFNGHNQSGTQKCLCGDCGCSYTLNPKEHKLSDEKVLQIHKLLLAGISGRKVGQLLGIGKNTAYAVIKKNPPVA
jgi:transposase-like protein